jgi:NAD(P)-dependent dehydrogenase (short-subunit alcohol dehydrogenase family)
MHEADYKEKVAIVTGAASGIGLALAEEMLSCGAASVALLDIDAEALARQSQRLGAEYPDKVVARRCDVTREAEVVEAVDAVVASAGRIDLLFNNAGAGFGGRFEAQSNEDWERAFALNFYGPLYAIRAVLPVMHGQGSGHIVNIVSGIAFAPMAQQTMYAATKAALNALSLALRYEVWVDGVRVSSATPGTTATAIWPAGGPPPHAQSPQQATRAILAGVARNERLILGDARDAESAAHAFDPAAAAGMDAYLLDVARRRRKGETAV